MPEQVKPYPVGVLPRRDAQAKRVQELAGAIHRYVVEAGIIKPVVAEWAEELAEIVRTLTDAAAPRAPSDE